MPTSQSLALSARDIRHSYPGALALDGVTLDVPAGQSVALVGESGSGKSTLLRCFNRMVNPQSGVITVGGLDVRERPAELLRRSIGYVPQRAGLMPHWRVLRNVALVPRLCGMDDVDARAMEALEMVGLAAKRFASRYPHE